MLDFTAVRAGQQTMRELSDPLIRADLRRLTNEMIDTMLGILAECEDVDVTFEPHDPDAPAAEDDTRPRGWTLGHIITHTTASAEEAAFLAAEQARGVEFHGRSRYEAPWEGITTVAECRARLEESRRMRLASLDVWPDAPHLHVTREIVPSWGPLDAKAYFLLGLLHDSIHLGQLAETARQAREARDD